jgi:hypothetical protein
MQQIGKYQRSSETASSDCHERLKATKVAAAYLPMSKARGIRSFFGDKCHGCFPLPSPAEFGDRATI